MSTDPGAAPRESALVSPAQTLSRGVRVLEILSESPRALTIAEIAEALGTHRSVAYRILRTLEDHLLLSRDDAGRFRLGSGLAVLARNVARGLQSAALPELILLSDHLDMTAFIAVWDRDECVTLAAIEPHHTRGAVVQRPGSRHPVHSGAPGIAIQSAFSEEDWNLMSPSMPYRPQATAARSVGYAESHDEVIQGVSSVAVPVVLPGERPAALAVVYVRSSQDATVIGAELLTSAQRMMDRVQ